MDYDFSGLCADQVEKLQKRLVTLKKAFMKEYDIALNVINKAGINEKRGAIKTEIDDLFNDVSNKASIFYTECMNKVQRVLTNNLS
jgi:hypothetical protein